jgi:hypothetical protein
MQACPGCGLSLADNSAFCPTCGWRKPATAAEGASASAPTTWGAAPTASDPTTPIGTDDPNPSDSMGAVRKALGYAVVPASMIVGLVIWWVALHYLKLKIHHDLSYPAGIVAFFYFGAITAISITVAEWIYPPAGWHFDKQAYAESTEDAWAPGRLATMVVFIVIWLAVVTIAIATSR